MPVRIHWEAEAGFWAAVACYEDKLPGLGLGFVEEFERALEVIRAAPARWRVRGHDARRYNLNRFSYYIAYVDMPDLVWIVAVAHGRRRPGYWPSRLARD